MKNFLLIFLFIVWVLLFFSLVLALTDVYPGLIQKRNGFFIGIILISVTGFIRFILSKNKAQNF